ncbi:MAG: Tic22 family protein [Limnothrix sp.]
MNSIIRFSRQFLLAGVAIAGSTLGFNLPAALALPEAVVIEKLKPVPMYMLINDSGQPIFASVENENGDATGVTGIFVSPSDAERLVLSRREEAKKILQEEQASGGDTATITALTQQVELWEEANILPISLDKIYEFAQSDDAADLSFKFFPTMKQLNAAAQVIEGQTFPGVPLFFLSMQSTNEQGEAITTFPTSDKDGKIPVFFEVEPILEQIEGFGSQEDLNINVMALEVFIAKLVDQELPADEQEFFNEMTLIPVEESTRLIQSIIEQQQGQQGN